MNKLTLQPDSLIAGQEYYFEKGREALKRWMELDLSTEDITSLGELVIDYQAFVRATLNVALEDAREAIFEVISYCDTHARDKKKYNKYSDNRVLAKAAIRMGPWVKHVFNYKYHIPNTNIGVRYALQMLSKPLENINILSVDHRKFIADYYLGEQYNESTFISGLISLVDSETRRQIPNEDNLTVSIAKQIYKEKENWFPKINNFAALKPILEKHIFDNQLDIAIGHSNPKEFYWLVDSTGLFDSLDAHYEIHKDKDGKISVDLHFEGASKGNKELSSLFGELPDYLERKPWQGVQAISHTRKFDLNTPDLIEGLLECYNELYDSTADTLLKKLKERFPHKALTMDLTPTEQKASTLLAYKKQIILQGPPGTGKTRAAERIAKTLLKIDGDKVYQKPKKIDEADLKRFITVGLKLRSVSDYSDYEVMEITDSSFKVKTLKTEKVYPASFARIISYYEDEKWSKVGTIKWGNDSYEAALAKYVQEQLELEEQVETLKNTERLRILQFHPSYTYEDFVRGISTNTNGASIIYKATNRILVDMADKATLDPTRNYILILDEINRANLSSVLGELIYALEYRGREVESMYAVNNSNKISLPGNLYIIGTMNTADRSVGHIDYAIRRRFAFVDLLPEKLTDNDKIWFNTNGYEKVERLFNRNNVSNEFDVKDVQLGHSYFIVKKKDAPDAHRRDELFKLKMDYEIKPILREYFKDGVLIGKIDAEEVSVYIDNL